MSAMQPETSKEQLLEELGLSKNDAKVYLALLKGGASTVTVISKKSGIHRANVYGALDRLKAKGLVSEYVENMKRSFKAADPSTLSTLLQEKELRLKAVLPQFQLDYQLSQDTNMVEVYEGAAALRNALQHFVDIGEDIFAFGAPKEIVRVIGEHFLEQIHRKRAAQKQWMHHIYNSDAVERMNLLNALPFTKAQSLPPEFDLPVTTTICGDEVTIISLLTEKPTLISIKNKVLAEGYRKYFGILWKQTSKPK